MLKNLHGSFLESVFKKFKNNFGYSLVEILTVTAIIFVLVLIAFPFLKDYTKNLELKNSTKQIVSNLKLAQQFAVTEQNKYSIQVDLLDSTYRLIKKGQPDETVDSFLISENVIFSQTSGIQNNEAVFNPTGAIDYNGYIILTHTNNLKIKITIKPSGYLSWENYEE